MLRRILVLLAFATMLPLAGPAPAQDRDDNASIARMAIVSGLPAGAWGCADG